MKTKTNKDKNFQRIFKLLYQFYGPRHWWPARTRLEVIVGAILTQNTAWQNVEKAIRNFKKKRKLSANELFKIEVEKLASLIRSSGYYNQKAMRLKNFIHFLFNHYQGSLDKMFKEEKNFLRQKLLNIKGLGEETVDSILLYAGKIPIFVVDAYTRRIFSRHGLIEEKDTYGDIQKRVMKNLKKDAHLFNEYHALIVELGKAICRKKPNCSLCPLKGIPKVNYA